MSRSNGVSALRVSVLITNHNYGRFLEDCLASVAAQTLPAHQVIVVDDGSTDDSRRRLADAQSMPGLQVILQEQRGQVGAIDTAISAADGDLLCLLDADDAFTPDKLARVTAIFDAYPEVQWLRHPLALVDQDMRLLGPRVPPIVRSGVVVPSPELIAERVVTAATSGLVLRRSLAQQLIPLSPTHAGAAAFRLTRDADALVLGRIARLGAPGFTANEPLALYRRHEEQMYPDSRHVTVLLQRQIEVAQAVATDLGTPYHDGMLPSPCHKHAMILATLEGARRFAPARTREWLGGARSIAGSLLGRPVAAARQMAALTFAYVAPGTWLRRFHRGQAWTS